MKGKRLILLTVYILSLCFSFNTQIHDQRFFLTDIKIKFNKGSQVTSILLTTNYNTQETQVTSPDFTPSIKILSLSLFV